ncbi:hypothetical protein CYCD_07010 [Tenuifilaceae bacterium CYCD]|nr:hypothetical protein CYCD_07010 [Tenuifilaceae bacterium CYCD]
MKKFLVILIGLLFSETIIAQTPTGFSYQSVLRDSEGQVLANQNATLRISLTNNDGSIAYYSETHIVTSTAQGIVSLTVGDGQNKTGSFLDTPWGSQPIYINIEIMLSGASAYTQLGRQQLQSVPYALFAADGISVQWLGSLSIEPASPAKNQAYYNTTDKKSYIWDGNSWEILSQDGEIGPQGETGSVGPQGETGVQGVQGIQGNPGIDGISLLWLGSFDVTPTPSSSNQAYYNSTDKISYIWDGNSWEILVKDGPIGPQGETGSAGPQGESGSAGADGISLVWLGSYSVAPTPTGANQAYYNSAEKKSYIWDGDSWEIVVQDGAQGEQGIQGEKGLQGLQGLPGETGPQGAQGIQGETGPQGATGPQGEQGPTGPTGPQGPAGVGLTLRGEWSLDSTYVEGDYVFDESTSDPLINSMWICQSNVGPIATQPKDDATHWVEFEAPAGPTGPEGPQGPQGSTGPQGATGADGTSLLWLGTRTTNPDSPSLNNAYYNSTDKKSYVWNGSSWNIIAQDGSQGPIGQIGPQGLEGDIGDTGPAGPTGANGISLIWLGTKTSAPTTPSLNQAYYNSVLLKSYVWDGDSWEIIAQDGATGPKGDTGATGPIGATGANGISIIWLGNLATAPISPSLNQAYYNTTLFKSHIWDGDSWEILTQDGAQGTQGLTGPQGPSGTNGISIIWKGSLASAPSSPSLNWAYYNSSDKKSYVWDGDSWEIIAMDGAEGETGPMVSGANGQMLVHDGTTWAATSAITLKSDTLGIGLNAPVSRLIVQGDASALPSDPIFEVKNKDGKVVLGVYNEGVRVYVDDSGAKGARGGFAVGGLSTQTKGEVEYFRITPDSARIYIDTSSAKGAKGGFAIGGLSTQTKGGAYELMRVTKDSTRIYIGDNSTKGARGGFAVGGLSTQTKNTSYDLLRVTRDSTRIYVNESVTKGARGGFAVGGLSTQTKTPASQFMNITPDNYFIGHQAGDSINGGLYNSFMGYQSGKANTTGSSNVFLGYLSGRMNQTGGNNVVVGNLAGYLGATGSSNVFLGDSAGFGNTSSYNVFLGKGSGKANTGQYNSFMGYHAGLSNISGSNNVFIGNEAGLSNKTGSFNVFLGYRAGYSNTYSYNTFLGYQAGKANTNGQYNSFMGYNAGLSNQSGSSNIFIGNASGQANIAGSNNVFLGNLAGLNSNASNNIFLGNEAGRHTSSGNNNAFLGNNAGKANTIGSSNVFIGNQSGANNTEGGDNVFLGTQAGFVNTTGFYNTILGFEAGLNNNGSDNTFIGYRAGKSQQSQGGNVYIGSKAGRDATNGTQNVYIGESTGLSTTYGKANVFIGYEAGLSTTGDASITDKGSYNVYLGYQAGRAGNLVFRNVFLGYQAGMNTYAGVDNEGSVNVFIGSEAGLTNTIGYANTALGEQALKSNTTGYGNVAIGRRPLISNISGIFNIAVGNTALFYNQTGKGNVAVGSGALGSVTASDHSVAVGEGALILSLDSANVAVGPYALGYLRNGINNTAIGKKANVAVLMGTYNNTTAIGYEAVVNASDQVVIGNASVTSFIVKGVYNATSTDAPNVYVSSTGQVMRTTASTVTGSGTTNKIAFWNGSSTITSNSNLHWDNTNSYLGIGETTPDARLHINQATGSLPIRITKATSSNYWGFGVRVAGTDNDDLVFAYNGTVKGYIDDADGSWDQASDMRLKEDIRPLGSVLSKVLMLKPSSFYFKNTGNPNKKSIGFIAQDVEELFPNLVNTFKEENGIVYKGLSYNDFAVLSIQSIIELNQKLENTIKAQEETIDNLKQEVDLLKIKIEEILQATTK